jgi:hypothetical protein
MKILEQISLCLLLDNLVPCVLGIHRQQICIELKHLSSSGFALVLRGLCGKLGFLVVSLILCAQFWIWCISQSHAFLGLLQSLLRSFLGKFLESFLTLAHGGS